eukprot:TRINITY_DN13344_c0_g1_i5.p1 TRINITY_DN13344_c0_g1~~TRINITY_DN13344_c0_g1_i5.p1  ORF type:complete len:291 (+),score=35.64 TRINITY_DN13344_c0_g1_i5:183-1055(+)
MASMCCIQASEQAPARSFAEALGQELPLLSKLLEIPGPAKPSDAHKSRVIPGDVRIITVEDFRGYVDYWGIPRASFASPDFQCTRSRDKVVGVLERALETAPESFKRGCVLGVVPVEHADEVESLLKRHGLHLSEKSCNCARMVAPELSADGVAPPSNVDIVELGPDDARLKWVAQHISRDITLLKYYAEEMPAPPLVAMLHGLPVGCITFDSDDFSIGGLFIDPGCRGKGIAAALLNKVAELARSAGCPRPTSFIEEGNEKSLRAHARAGWRQDGLGDYVWLTLEARGA